jgi:hypothetical protein
MPTVTVRIASSSKLNSPRGIGWRSYIVGAASTTDAIPAAGDTKAMSVAPARNARPIRSDEALPSEIAYPIPVDANVPTIASISDIRENSVW